jgi:hypothetical protein
MPKYLKTKEGSLESAVEAVSAAQRAAIAISKKEKAGKPGYDKEGKSLKDDMTTEDKEAYEKFFKSALKKFKVDSPADFKSDEEKKKFFDYIDKNYKADNEETQKNEEVKEAYGRVKKGHYDVKVTIKNDRDAEAIDSWIKNNMGQTKDIEDIDNDGIIKGGSGYEKGDIYIQGDDAGEYGMEIAKKFGSKVVVVGEETVKEETLAQRAARHISDMWVEGAKVKKEEEKVEEEETPKKKKESKKTTMTGKPMNDIVVNPKSQDD